VVDDAHAVGVIADDEPRFSVDSATVTEGNSGTTAAVFTVRLAAAYDQAVSVDFATADGSALAGSDYRAATGTVTFNPGGPLTQTVTVLVNGDRLAEYDYESFSLNLSNPGSGVVTGNGTGYIQDNEPRISIGSVYLKEGNSGTTYFVFTVSLSAAYDQAVTVNYATQNGSATAGSDYKAASGTLTFAAGQTTKTISIAVYGDTQKENDEYFYLVLSAPSTNAQVYNGWGMGSILNDDGTPRKKRR